MKKLLIVESPAKIKTIAKFISTDFKILSTRGHIMDLPQRKLGVTLNGGIGIEYVVLENKEKVIEAICKEAARAGQIFLAPDPDREGEIIAWHVAEEIKRQTKKHGTIYRIAFNEITKPAIEAALATPSSLDLNKVAAQQARRILDRWVGYEVSPILWRKVSKGLSAGRVQSVALRLICDREEEIRAFKPEEYWSIEALFRTPTSTFTAALTQKNKKKIALPNQESTQEVLEECKTQAYTVTAVKDSKRQRNPPPPFMTSTLQQAAYNRLGFSVEKTMMLAQRLYEGVPLEDPQNPVALITYMRTDSLRIAEIALTAVRGYIKDSYGSDYLPPKSMLYSKGGAQDAHEAIRPITVDLAPEQLTKLLPDDLGQLYELIWRRFVSCQMKAATYAQRSVTVEGGAYTFKATGSTLLFDGFLRAYQEPESDEQEKEKKATLPEDLREKLAVPLESLTPKQHFTEAPPRYTQASLVKELEKEGIGRPSTYATILKTIQARAYTSLDTKKRFIPSDLGMLVIRLLVEHLPKIMNTKFTATMELELDAVAQGNLERDKLLKAFYADFSKDVAIFAGTQKQKSLERLEIACAQCGGELVVRFGKAGPFVGCATYPRCTFTSSFTRTPEGTIVLQAAQQPKLLEEACPACTKPLRQLRGKFGPFVACSGYPACTYIQQKTARFPCPTCGAKIVQKRGKGSIFWGCAAYPQCTFTIRGDIEEQECTTCSSPYLLKTTNQAGETLLACPKPECS